MNQIAVCIGDTFIYWSSVIIFLGIAACFALTYALYTSHGGRGSALWLLLPLALFFSVVFARLIHWYCHDEQYAGFMSAMLDYSQGDYFLHGAIFGTMLAGLLVKKLGFTQNLGRLFDCLAPGAALCIAFIRLSALFNTSCRSKIVVNTPALQHLPLASGTYQQGSHRIVNIDRCLNEDEVATSIIVTIRRLLPGFRLLPYDEDARTGFLRHVLVRRGVHTGQIMVVLVTATPVFPSRSNFIKALLREHPQITTIVQNINSRKTSVLLGDREQVLYGPGSIRDTLCGKTFCISPRSFYQINPAQTEVLYRCAIEAAGLTGRERVLDAYCGIGTIGILAAEGAGEVIGVEQNPAAVRDAIRNARLNGVKNIRFVAADATAWMQAAAEDHLPLDVLMMDPPRSGSTPEFLAAAARLSPRRIVYISCCPETQARDLALLQKSGYRVTLIQPVDMFPHTEHVETVCLLSKLPAKQQ